MLLRKKIYQIGLTAIIFALGVFSFVSAVSAQTPLISTVQFEQSPLFNNVNFVPGDSMSRWVKLNNTTTDSHRVILRAINVVNTGNLKDVIGLVIKQGSTVLYDNTFADLFSLSELILPQVPANSSSIFDFIAIFKNTAGNDYQKSAMGFNLQIGFEDLDTVADDTTTSIGGGGGGSIIIGQKNLIISNDSIVSETLLPEFAIILWDTSIPSTSQVVYGLASDSPYSLNLTLANFGYPSATIENLTKVINHSVEISGLISGESYVYRVISRASPPSISREYSFTTAQKKNLSETEEVLFETPPEGEGEIAYQQEAEEAEELSQSKELPFSQIDLPPAEPPVNSGISGAEEEMENNITDEQQEEEVPKKSMLMAGIGSLLSHGTGNIWMDFTLGIIIILIIAGIVYYFIARERRKKKENPE